MKLIPLTKGQFAKVDEDDYDFLMQWKWQALPNKYGNFYATRSKYINGRSITLFMHRIINKTPDGLVTDHIDRDGLNNQKTNLRSCSQSQNMINVVPRKKSSSVYKGVTKRGKMYVASIMFKRVQVEYETYEQEKEAAFAYNKMAIKYFGEFAVLNNVNENDFVPKGKSEGLGKRIKVKTSKYRGVYFDKTRGDFVAFISIKRKTYNIGRFKKETDAALSYNKMALEIFGDKAKLNIL